MMLDELTCRATKETARRQDRLPMNLTECDACFPMLGLQGLGTVRKKRGEIRADSCHKHVRAWYVSVAKLLARAGSFDVWATVCESSCGAMPSPSSTAHLWRRLLHGTVAAPHY